VFDEVADGGAEASHGGADGVEVGVVGGCLPGASLENAGADELVVLVGEFGECVSVVADEPFDGKRGGFVGGRAVGEVVEAAFQSVVGDGRWVVGNC